MKSSSFRVALAVVVGLALAACAADGGFAGKGRPVDVPATVKASCASVSAADGQFQAFAAAHPGKIDANGMNTEGGVIASFYNRGKDGTLTAAPGGMCDPAIKPNLIAAETSLLSASLQIANLLATWQR